MSTMSLSSFAVGLTELPDRHYTPPTLAKALVECIAVDTPVTSVVDFAAGTGNLLKAAASRWPDASLLGSDVDEVALAQASGRLEMSWTGCGDFLASDYDVRSSHPSAAKHDVILLNPPFTQAPGRSYVPRGDFSAVRCSRAMAFVMTAASYLEDGGQLAAILPTSTLTNVQDSEARKALSEQFHFDVMVGPRYGHFEGLDVSVFILRLSRRVGPGRARLAQAPIGAGKWNIRRGRVSMRRSDRQSVGLSQGWIHTTSIQGGAVVERYSMPTGATAVLSEPGALIVPRVGSFGAGNVLLMPLGEREVLSDCLLALSTSRRRDVEAAYDSIMSDFDKFRSLYSGTGAPYVTNGQLHGFLSEIA